MAANINPIQEGNNDRAEKVIERRIVNGRAEYLVSAWKSADDPEYQDLISEYERLRLEKLEKAAKREFKSLIPDSGIRYEGKAVAFDGISYTWMLKDVRSHGTEDRDTPKFVPPLDETFGFIAFKLSGFLTYEWNKLGARQAEEADPREAVLSDPAIAEIRDHVPSEAYEVTPMCQGCKAFYKHESIEDCRRRMRELGIPDGYDGRAHAGGR